MRAKKQKTLTLTKVSEWIAAGDLTSGYYLLEQLERETEKAYGFSAKKWCPYSGWMKPGVCWLPKSQVQRVENDFYTHGPRAMFLVPEWLYRAKGDQGFDL